jgi:hypothetical protein
MTASYDILLKGAGRGFQEEIFQDLPVSSKNEVLQTEHPGHLESISPN